MAVIADILNSKGRDVHSVTPATKVYDAIAKMVDISVGALLIADGDTIHGIMTERDYLGKIALEGRSSKETSVQEIMSSQLIYVTPDNDVEEVMAMMTEARVRHMPVMDNQRLVGLVSIGDCVKRISAERKSQIRYLTDYIQDKYPG
jgi:CBS domain-containing protein